jgi:hypothetical protein
MKKLLGLFLGFLFIYSCGTKQDEVERYMENGVEVVINHVEPYKIKGERSTFKIEEELIIDTEREGLAELGMGSAGEFNVDSKGNIYIMGFKNEENFIYKFDRNGNYVTSFGKRGQGPGELEWPMCPVINEQDEMVITDRKKLIIFGEKGNLIDEIRIKIRTLGIEPLPNGKYIVFKPKSEISTPEYYPYSLSLCDSEFKEIKELDIYKWQRGNPRLTPFFMWRVSKGHIYIANGERGYEIWVYDFEGNLVRKIKKEYKPVTVSEEIKKLILGPGYEQPGISHDRYFPKPLPPLNQFFVDDGGRLFVMTYEEGENPEEYIYDIFNPDGVFVGRKSLHMVWAGMYLGPKYAMVKKGYLYCHREKESGYRELMVYKMKWE